MDMYQIVKKPLVTEKGTIMLSEGNWVTFKVHLDSNKIEIREAVQKIFSVSVLQVNTQIVRGKRKRFGRTMGAEAIRSSATLHHPCLLELCMSAVKPTWEFLKTVVFHKEN